MAPCPSCRPSAIALQVLMRAGAMAGGSGLLVLPDATWPPLWCCWLAGWLAGNIGASTCTHHPQIGSRCQHPGTSRPLEPLSSYPQSPLLSLSPAAPFLLLSLSPLHIPSCWPSPRRRGQLRASPVIILSLTDRSATRFVTFPYCLRRLHPSPLSIDSRNLATPRTTPPLSTPTNSCRTFRPSEYCSSSTQ